MLLLTPTAMQIGVLAKNKLRCLHLLLPVKQTSVCEEGERRAGSAQKAPALYWESYSLETQSNLSSKTITNTWLYLCT